MISELDVRRAEQTINALIREAKLNGGKVFVVRDDNKDFCIELDGPVSLTYYEFTYDRED